MQCDCSLEDLNFEWLRWKLKTERDEAPFCIEHQTATEPHTAQWNGAENRNGSSEKSRELISG